MINTILVLCLGNICRSPMAEGLFKQALPEKKIFSAGITAMVGHPADPFTIEILQQRGIDISEHRGQGLVSWMVSQADLIMTMDIAQKQYVEQKYPSAKGKVFRLGEYANSDIADPYRKDKAAFEQSYTLINAGVEEWVKRLHKIEQPVRPVKKAAHE
ncbi:low molecular weight protein-tyrosine-phosphatase [Glaciimonas sp. PCH181]|uniref:low molecular weight protein-tyrosine-phosphatase n=1 Tax=Glaciimonas sp. PCH181 TaxID=2133943 RepID=UPI000D3BFB26|nr:low molecular weight protein-tyrosine-phosphatase [Glaciimonas sp. PCH181]PUA16922.1 protein tyrosine phosphatase [Glaciimonas sp. PCH181]